MTAAELLLILKTAFKETGPAGETALDRLVRKATAEPEARRQILIELRNVLPELQSGRDWQALEILVSQLDIREPHIGEQAEQLLTHAEIGDAEASIWMARCAYELGGTLTQEAYEVLERPEVVQSNPTEWLAVMFDTSDAHAVERYFRELPSKIDFDLLNASDVIRLFKRRAPDMALNLNNSLSLFLDKMDPAVARAVAEKLEPVIGPSFKRLERANTEQIEVSPHTNDDIATDFADLFVGLENVSENGKWAQQYAEAA